MLTLVGAPAGRRPLGRGGELAHLDSHLDGFSRSQFDPETYGRNSFKGAGERQRPVSLCLLASRCEATLSIQTSPPSNPSP